MLRSLCAPALLLTATPALAEEAREFCADRPGLGTPSCTLAPGSAMVEIGLAAWDHSRGAATVEDDVTLGDMLLRVGVSETAEVHLGVTGHVIQRARDRGTGAVDRITGIGDGTLAVRQSLSGPNGPIAFQAFVTVPLAKRPIGSREWSGGVLLPVNFALKDGLDFALVPRLAVVANADRRGHHVNWGGVVGLTQALGKSLSVTGEIAAFREEDPDGRSTDARIAGSLAWQVGARLQLDLECDVGLIAGAPDRTLAVGLAWQFR